MRAICAIVASLLLAGTTFGDTINVPADYPTIQVAIDAANNGDEINIAAGTYNEANLNPGGKAITIQGTLNGDGSLATTIDAQQNGNVFTIVSGEDNGTVIQNLSITGGANASLDGGGIYCNQSSPTIAGCTIFGNTSQEGSGIHCYNNASPTISDCTIKDNTALVGGIYCEDSNPTISNCTIEGNTANFYGGGIYCDNSNPTISGCTIKDNTADYDGGGIYCKDSNPTISGCTFTNNFPTTIVCDFNMSETASTTGACCVSSGCHALTEDACAGMGGTWLGEDSSCDDCAPACAGDTDNDGTVGIEDLLIVIERWGFCP